MDRSTHVYDGIGESLEKAYTSVANNTTTSGYDCSAYDKIVLYVSVSAVNTGVVTIQIDVSPDNSSFYALYIANPASGTFYECKQSLTATGDYALTFPACGSFFRIRTTYVSGTSLTIDAIQVEGKS